MIQRTLLTSFLLVGLGWASVAAAAEIPIAGATATQFSDQFPPASAHDGLTEESEPGPGPHTDTYWLSENGLLSDSISFDLDTTDSPGGWEVTSVEIVNTSNSGWNDRETDEFGLEVYDSSAAAWISIVPDGTPIETYWPDVKTVDVTGANNITQVRLNVANLPDVGPVTGDDAGTGLNEVTIFGNAVPEPSSLGMIFIAFGLLIGHFRRRFR